MLSGIKKTILKQHIEGKTMNESKIELVKLYNGDYIVGEGTGMESDNILKVELKNPRILALIPSASGITAALKPVCFPFTSKRLKEKIVYKTIN